MNKTLFFVFPLALTACAPIPMAHRSAAPLKPGEIQVSARAQGPMGAPIAGVEVNTFEPAEAVLNATPNLEVRAGIVERVDVSAELFPMGGAGSVRAIVLDGERWKSSLEVRAGRFSNPVTDWSEQYVSEASFIDVPLTVSRHGDGWSVYGGPVFTGAIGEVRRRDSEALQERWETIEDYRRAWIGGFVGASLESPRSPLSASIGVTAYPHDGNLTATPWAGVSFRK